MQSLSPQHKFWHFTMSRCEDKLRAIKLIKINCIAAEYSQKDGNAMGTDSSEIRIRFIKTSIGRHCHGKVSRKHKQSHRNSTSTGEYHSKDHCQFTEKRFSSLHNSIIIININIKSGCDLFVIEPDDDSEKNDLNNYS